MPIENHILIRRKMFKVGFSSVLFLTLHYFGDSFFFSFQKELAVSTRNSLLWQPETSRSSACLFPSEPMYLTMAMRNNDKRLFVNADCWLLSLPNSFFYFHTHLSSTLGNYCPARYKMFRAEVLGISYFTSACNQKSLPLS